MYAIYIGAAASRTTKAHFNHSRDHSHLTPTIAWRTGKSSLLEYIRWALCDDPLSVGEGTELLNHIAELQVLDLDEFIKIRSPLAQAIYLYIPSRAHHHSEEKPFEIALTRLLEQVSFRIPPQKQRRHQIFTQHENDGRSVLQQLDGRETLAGVFRVRLVETSDGTEWKLLAWVEHRKRLEPGENSNSKIVAAYLESGRPPELLHQALRNIQPLNDYELELLTAGKIEIQKCRKLLEVARALLGEGRFVGLLGEAKGDEIEGRKAKKNPTARLIYRIVEAVGTPVPRATKGKS